MTRRKTDLEKFDAALRRALARELEREVFRPAPALPLEFIELMGEVFRKAQRRKAKRSASELRS